MGTPAYAPVEQYGSGTEIRSDIYSLGATLYHLLTGQEPPVAPTRLSASKDTLVAPHQINPQVSRAMSGAIVKAMGIRPSERFESTAAFRRTLRSISTSSKPRRSRTNLAIFAAILLFLCPVMFILAGSLISLTESLPQQTTGDSYRALSDNTPAPTTVPGNKSVTSSPIRVLVAPTTSPMATVVSTNAPIITEVISMATPTITINSTVAPTSSGSVLDVDQSQSLLDNQEVTLLRGKLEEAFFFGTVHRFEHIQPPITIVEVISAPSGKKKIVVQWAIDDSVAFYLNIQSDIRTLLETIAESGIAYEEVHLKGTYFLMNEGGIELDDSRNWKEAKVIEMMFSLDGINAAQDTMYNLDNYPPPFFSLAESLWMDPNFATYLRKTFESEKENG